MKYLLVVLAMWVLSFPSVYAGETAGTDTAQGEAGTQTTAPKAKVPRLRFKNGPVCMCGHGLSEAEIEQAEKDRKQKNERSDTHGVKKRSKRREQ